MYPNQAVTDQDVAHAAKFVFREVTTADELEEMFRFRYRLMADSPIEGLCSKHIPGIDIDGFDARSRHFGLYLQSDHGERLVGCQRGVYALLTNAAPAVHEITDRIGRRVAQSKSLLPVLEYWPDPEPIERLCRAVRSEGNRITESTRLFLSPEIRQTGLAQSMIEAVIAVHLLYHGVALGFATVSTHRRAYYRRHGFTPVPGTVDSYVRKARQEGSCLMITTESIPTVRRPRLEALADDYACYGLLGFSAHVSLPLSRATRSLGVISGERAKPLAVAA